MAARQLQTGSSIRRRPGWLLCNSCLLSLAHSAVGKTELQGNSRELQQLGRVV